ncbi:hypothetical protein QUF64_03005 [Anaerolineales bacterium HSG6]|nr:hypothetical protein [Anaerolineales bacterium HSG6]
MSLQLLPSRLLPNIQPESILSEHVETQAKMEAEAKERLAAKLRELGVDPESLL